MYCKKCGFKLEDNVTVCPFCNKKVDEVKKEISSGQNNNYNEYKRLDNENQMNEIRTHLGYVNLKTKFWHHVLIACGGYLFMNVMASIIGAIVIGIYQSNGYDFSCIADASSNKGDIYACPIEQLSPYLFVNALVSVIAEIGTVLAVLFIFLKYVMTFINQAKDRETWKWYGIGLAIMYGGNYIYSYILNVLQLTSSSSNQDAVNEMIFNNPLLGFLFVVVAAPLFEEIIFRFGVFRSFTHHSKKVEMIGIALTVILFAGIHMVSTFEAVFADAANPDYELLKSDLLSFPVYLIGSFGLTFAYYKSKNLMTPIAMHMTYNGISFIMILLLESAVPVEAFIRFLPFI